MSTVVANSLLEKLKELQAKEGLSDYKFADKLRVSHQLWQMTRTGRREIGLAVLQGALRAYPELNRDVLFFLGWDVSITSKVVANATAINHNTPERVYKPFLAGFRRKVVSTIQRLF